MEALLGVRGNIERGRRAVLHRVWREPGGRRYHGQLHAGEPIGPARWCRRSRDPAARECAAADLGSGAHEDQTLTLIADSGRAPVAPPLEEIRRCISAAGWRICSAQLHAAGSGAWRDQSARCRADRRRAAAPARCARPASYRRPTIRRQAARICARWPACSKR